MYYLDTWPRRAAYRKQHEKALCIQQFIAATDCNRKEYQQFINERALVWLLKPSKPFINKSGQTWATVQAQCVSGAIGVSSSPHVRASIIRIGFGFLLLRSYIHTHISTDKRYMGMSLLLLNASTLIALEGHSFYERSGLDK